MKYLFFFLDRLLFTLIATIFSCTFILIAPLYQLLYFTWHLKFLSIIDDDIKGLFKETKESWLFKHRFSDLINKYNSQ